MVKVNPCKALLVLVLLVLLVVLVVACAPAPGQPNYTGDYDELFKAVPTANTRILHMATVQTAAVVRIVDEYAACYFWRQQMQCVPIGGR